LDEFSRRALKFEGKALTFLSALNSSSPPTAECGEEDAAQGRVSISKGSFHRIGKPISGVIEVYVRGSNERIKREEVHHHLL